MEVLLLVVNVCIEEIFKLNEVYDTNSMDFKRILRIKYINESKKYIENVNDILHMSKSSQISGFDEELLYGISFDQDKFQDELLSKTIYDIVMKN